MQCMLISLHLCTLQYTLYDSDPFSQGHSFHEAKEEFQTMFIMFLYQLVKREYLELCLHGGDVHTSPLPIIGTH